MPFLRPLGQAGRFLCPAESQNSLSVLVGNLKQVMWLLALIEITPMLLLALLAYCITQLRYLGFNYMGTKDWCLQ